MSVPWSYFNKFDAINDIYLPDRGEGDTQASQIVTAINKLVYKWYNDGDVFDNTFYLDGWANDLSSYANWLHSHDLRARSILGQIHKCRTEDDYEELLKKLCDVCLDEYHLDQYSQSSADGSVYDCDGPYKFEWKDEEDEDEEEYYDWR